MNSNVEILAPAGSLSALKVAVVNGAGAVYLGIGELNARVKANNFSLDDLAEGICYAHSFNTKVYVAFNTILKKDEICSAVKQIQKATAMGVDAFIIQDLALVKAIQEAKIDCLIHASTQLGIHNTSGAKVAKELGFSRVILSREATLADIIDIKKNVDIEVECFVHGALCVSFSGNCYMSSMFTGNSGNRGRCLQFCRKTFKLKQNGNIVNTGHLLSCKDLNYIDNLSKLVAVGVDSFKIEGRLRREEYVAMTVTAYKNALTGNIIPEDKDNLNILFNRGNGSTSHTFNPTANTVYPHNGTNIGHIIGKIKSVNNGVATINFTGKNSLQKNDGVKFMRQNLEVGSSLVGLSGSNITYKGNVKAGDNVCLTTSTALSKKLLQKTRQNNVDVNCTIKIGHKAEFKFRYDKFTAVSYSDDIITESINSPITKEKLTASIKAFGSDIYVMRDITLDIDENCFMSVGQIKNMRRLALSSLIKQINDSYLQRQKTINNNANKNTLNNYFSNINFAKIERKSIMVAVDNLKNVTDYVLGNADYIVYNPVIFSLNDISKFVSLVGTKAVVNLPNIIRDSDTKVIADIVNNCECIYILNNIAHFDICKNRQVIIGTKLNHMTSYTNNTIAIASFESEKFNRDSINYIYGKVPLMTLTHCTKKNLIKESTCKGCNGYKNLSLVDEKDFEFTLRHYRINHCYSELINATVLDNREYISQDCKGFYIDLTLVDNVDDTLKGIINKDSNALINHMHGNYTKKLN